MLRLTREVRFAVNPEEDGQLQEPVTNGFAGYPSMLGLAHYLSLEVTLAGEPQKESGYVRNIKEIDQAVRECAIPLASGYVRRGRLAGGGLLLTNIYERLKDCWPGAELQRLRLSLSPFMTLSLFSREFPMVRLSQKFEFSASHRLDNPALGQDQNRDLFGKCNNPHGHGHNYVLQVTLAGKPDTNGHLIDTRAFEKIVAETVIDPFDHRYLNLEIPAFKDLNPTVENIAMVIYKMLKPKLEITGIKLAGVTLWETSKTWAEYLE